MAALHAMDFHSKGKPGSAVLGLYAKDLPAKIMAEHVNSPELTRPQCIGKIISQMAVSSLNACEAKPDTTASLRDVPGGIGDLCVYFVADEMGSHSEIVGEVIANHSEIQRIVARGIHKAFCMGAEFVDTSCSLYVSMVGTGLELRTDSSKATSLPSNYRLV